MREIVVTIQPKCGSSDSEMTDRQKQEVLPLLKLVVARAECNEFKSGITAIIDASGDEVGMVTIT